MTRASDGRRVSFFCSSSRGASFFFVECVRLALDSVELLNGLLTGAPRDSNVKE
jgi:hypothetical protein